MRYLLAILLLAGSALAVDAIDTVHTTVWTADYYNPLGSPRQQILMLSDSLHVAVFEDDGKLRLSYNGVSSWVDTYTMGDITSNHAHLWAEDDTVYVTGRGTNQSTYSFYDAGASDYWTLIGADTVSTTYTECTVASIVRLPDSDTTILVMGNDGGFYAINYVSAFSTDDGTSWSSDTVRVTSVGSNIVRMGTIANSLTAYTVVWYTDDEIEWFKFDRASSTWSSDGSAFNFVISRGYCMTIYDDTVQFCSSLSRPDSTNIYAYYAWKHIDSTAWNRDSFYVSSGYSGTAETTLGTTLTYIEGTKRLVLTYQGYEGDVQTDDSIMVYIAYWDWGTEAFVGNQKISTGYGVCQGTILPTAPYFVPSAWGDQMMVLYESAYGGDYDSRVTTVTFTAEEEGAATGWKLRNNVVIRAGVIIR